MKVRLAVNEVPLVGYVNVDPVPKVDKDNDFNILVRDIKDLTGICETSECTELRAEEVLDFVSLEQLGNVLNHWVSKLRHGGKIIVGGTDSMSVSRAYLSGDINTQEYNELIHGSQTHPWAMKSGQVHLGELSEVLQKLGLKIIKKRLKGFQMTVEAVRP